MGVYTIPAGAPFLSSLARGIIARFATDPLAMAQCRILLPTRRACRLLHDTFRTEMGDSGGLLLPHLKAIGDLEPYDLDEDIDPAAQDAAHDTIGDGGQPPALAPLRRRFLLTRLLMATDRFGDTWENILPLADTLIRLIDHVHNEGLDLGCLDRMVPDALADHWQMTLDFLTVLRDAWPLLLKAEGACDPAARRHRSLMTLAARWRAMPPSYPVIAAGSTGSIPGTASLLHCVADLAMGDVVLPGLDCDLDDESWDQLSPAHPQGGLRTLLQRLGITRKAVALWPGTSIPPVSDLWREVMRPTATLDGWRTLDPGGQTARHADLDRIHRITTRHPESEARAIALLVRETLETSNDRIAIVTADRALARRIHVHARRYGIVIDDSAGEPLTDTPIGQLAGALLMMAQKPLDRIGWLRVLRHPALNWSDRDWPIRFEIWLRTAPLSRLSLSEAIAQFAGVTHPDDQDRCAYLQHWMALDASPQIACLVKALDETMRCLAGEAFFSGRAGEALTTILADLTQESDLVSIATWVEAAGLILSQLGSEQIQPDITYTDRVRLFGRLEARLIDAERVVLAGFNEGQWPPDPDHDPWFSRSMRIQAGLPTPEKKEGLSAHDVVQAASGRLVYLTRSLQVEGIPTQPSRWSRRLDVVAKAMGYPVTRLDDHPVHAWLKALDPSVEGIAPAQRPAPCPPLSARPHAISASALEALIRDPYSFYARRILRFAVYPRLRIALDAAQLGILYHAVLDDFGAAWPHTLPDDPLADLMAHLQTHLDALPFADVIDRVFEHQARSVFEKFITDESDHRATYRPLYREHRLAMTYPAGGTVFTLNARVDRMDTNRASGHLAIIDYKTGAVPGVGAVTTALAPQLSLEAWLAHETIDPATQKPYPPVDAVMYWPISASAARTVSVFSADGANKRKSITDLISALRTRVDAALGLLADPDGRFVARPDPLALKGWSGIRDYDHLSRVKEWSYPAADEEDDDDTTEEEAAA